MVLFSLGNLLLVCSCAVVKYKWLGVPLNKNSCQYLVKRSFGNFAIT